MTIYFCTSSDVLDPDPHSQDGWFVTLYISIYLKDLFHSFTFLGQEGAKYFKEEFKIISD